MLAIIGGSGLTQLANLQVVRREVMRTPYGDASGAITLGTIGRASVAFLARHGYGHTIPPHKVNFSSLSWSSGLELDSALADAFDDLDQQLVFGLMQLVPYRVSNPAVVQEPAWDSARTETLVRAACFDCHEDLWRGYQEHGMAQSYYPLTAETAVEAFPSPTLYHEGTDLSYRAIRRGDRFFQEEFRLSAEGDTTRVQ